jgi:hypothetical protein
MEISDLKPGMLVRNGSTLLRISNIYPPTPAEATICTARSAGYVTAQVLLEGRPAKPPGRTMVRSYTPEEVFIYFAPASKGQVKKLDEVYG